MRSLSEPRTAAPKSRARFSLQTVTCLRSFIARQRVETIDATCQLTLPDLRSTFKLSVENIVSPPTAEA